MVSACRQTDLRTASSGQGDNHLAIMVCMHPLFINGQRRREEREKRKWGKSEIG